MQPKNIQKGPLIFVMGRNIIESLYVNYKIIVIARDLCFDKNSKAFRGKLFRDKQFSAGITI